MLRLFNNKPNDMNLTLKVISHHQELLGDAATKSFDEQGGSFGRSDNNTWVIPDENRVVSGQHGKIYYEDGNFHLVDTSKNGIYLNDNSSPIGKGQVAVLQDGDILAFGDYQVQVCDVQEAIDTSPAMPENQESDPFFVAQKADVFGKTPDSEMRADRADFGQHELEDHREPAYDPLAGISSNSGQVKTGGPELPGAEAGLTPEFSHDGSSPQSSAFNPRSVKVDADLIPESTGELGQNIIPEGYDPLNDSMMDVESEQVGQEEPHIEESVFTESSQPVQPDSSLAPESKTVPAGAPVLDAYQAFLKGAGLDQLGLGTGGDPRRDLENAGALFRELVQGLMMLLQSRAELKNQFRMSATTIKPTENNPLKFSPHVEDALKTLFANERQGFLAGDKAVKEAIGDIRNHQIAMIVAMHAGIAGLLDKFQPRRFDTDEERGVIKSALLVAGKKNRAWENYRNYYERVVVESGDAFQILCAEEFNDAYDEQLRRLESGIQDDNRKK